MTKLLYNLMNQMGEFFPEFALFFNTHFEFVKETSLTPTFSADGNQTFTADYRIRRKDLKEEDKVEYYSRDLTLWRNIFEVEREDRG